MNTGNLELNESILGTTGIKSLHYPMVRIVSPKMMKKGRYPKNTDWSFKNVSRFRVLRTAKTQTKKEVEKIFKPIAIDEGKSKSSTEEDVHAKDIVSGDY